MQQHPIKEVVDRTLSRLNEVRRFIMSHDDHDGRTRNKKRAEQIVTLAVTEHGAAYLRSLLPRTDEEEFGNFVLNSVIAIHVLMRDKFGRRLVLDVLERCDAAQINRVLASALRDTRRFKFTCLNIYGCEAMKKLILRYLTTGANRTSSSPGRDMILGALRPISVELSESSIGCQIIQTCFELFSAEDTYHIALEIAPYCPNLAMDPVGCQSVQKYLETNNACRVFILEYVAEYALMLSQHQRGNYVVQCALKLRDYDATSTVVDSMKNRFVALSMDKFGSNVVEACLREGHPYHVAPIIVELVMDPDFLKDLQDQYGNFVVQSALRRSKGIPGHGTLHRFLVDAILRDARSLQGHMYGSRVLDMATGKKGLRNHGLLGNRGHL